MKDSMATQIDFPDVRIQLGELTLPNDDDDDDERGEEEDGYYDDKDFEDEVGDGIIRGIWRPGGGGA